MKKILLFIICISVSLPLAAQRKSTSIEEKDDNARPENLSAKEMMAEIEGKWELDDNNNVTFSQVIELPGMNASDIYDRALSYFTYNYGHGESVVQVENKEKGIIIGKGIFADVHIGISLIAIYVSTTHILRIDVKEGKARIIGTLQEYKQKIVGSGPPTYSSFPVSSRAPIAEKDAFKSMMSKAFYKSYKTMMKTFDNIERNIKDGNTSAEIENSEW